MNEIRKDIISVDSFEEDDKRDKDERSRRCAEVRVNANNVTININCRS
ncbi:hypothetical protein [uncultured Clostridium sp.]|nr:hypothetical protein [uncultured Clostridium sp.]